MPGPLPFPSRANEPPVPTGKLNKMLIITILLIIIIIIINSVNTVGVY
jgi:hypothetical protein